MDYGYLAIYDVYRYFLLVIGFFAFFWGVVKVLRLINRS